MDEIKDVLACRNKSVKDDDSLVSVNEGMLLVDHDIYFDAKGGSLMGHIEGISSKELQTFDELQRERARLRDHALGDTLDNLLGERENLGSCVDSALELDIDAVVEQRVKSKEDDEADVLTHL